MPRDDEYQAFPLHGELGAMALAAKIVTSQNKNPGEGLALANGLRQALQTMIISAAYTTYIQDEKSPAIQMGPEAAMNMTPSELLRALADAWDETQSHKWDEDVEVFTKNYRDTLAEIESEKFNKDFPEDISVSDILGE